jgi:hypothetical protein
MAPGDGIELHQCAETIGVEIWGTMRTSQLDQPFCELPGLCVLRFFPSESPLLLPGQPVPDLKLRIRSG